MLIDKLAAICRLDRAAGIEPEHVADLARLLSAWRDDYNRVRPHSALDNRTPEEFRLTLALAATTGNGHNFNPGLSL